MIAFFRFSPHAPYMWAFLFLLGCSSGETLVDKGKLKKEKPGPEALYKNPEAKIDARVGDLMQRMTLEEKVGQMTQLCNSSITAGGDKELKLDLEKIGNFITKRYVGSFLSGTGSAEEWFHFLNEMQHIAVNKTRLGIPIIFGIDHVHGANFVDEGTILPHNINIGCSFSEAIAADAAKVTAKETADLGMQWNFAPVMDIGKNARWPRLYETFGEDPLVCGRLGAAFIKAYQNCEACEPYKLAATAKHFIGYSDPKYGWDRAPAEIPDQSLYEQFVPSFKQAIDAGVKTIMVNSGEVNGEPVHRSKKYLKDLLRGRLGFEGVVLTDIKDIPKIVDMHKGAENQKAATLMALRAGIDMSMACNSLDFQDYVIQLVDSGNITMNRIDRSVERILKLKFELGLFENPYPQIDRIDVIGSQEHHDIALRAAKESIVLLKNNGVLPLPKNAYIDLGGFAADSRRMLNGPWTFEWLGAEEDRQPKTQHTLYEAIMGEFSAGQVFYMEKEDMFFDSVYQTGEYAVLTVGETPYSEFKGSVGDLELDEKHKAWITKAYEAGKRVIVIFIGGRPRIMRDVEPMIDALIFAGMPGQEGAEAIAQVLSGDYNPSGKLCFTWPAYSGHVHPYYVKSSEFHHSSTKELQPQYPFGHGLHYSEINYSDLALSDTVLSSLEDTLTATVKVKNGKGPAVNETALWFFRDEVGYFTRPVKDLVHFEKKFLKPGAEETYTLRIVPREHLGYPDAEGKMRYENGDFVLMVGEQEARFRLEMDEAVVVD